jgi:hypothetical protein
MLEVLEMADCRDPHPSKTREKHHEEEFSEE